MEAQGVPVTIANLAIHRHREEEMNRERIRHNQTVQEAASQRAREANKGKAREVVPDSEEEESEEMYSSPSEEWKEAWHPNNLLPFPVFIMRVATRFEVLEFPNDKFHVIRPVDTYVSYGDWRGERARGPSAEPQPETAATPSAPAQYSLEPTMHDVMRRFDRQDRQIARTQNMIRRAFPHVDFIGLGFSSSDNDES
ncbi:hypothetical protein PIB30_040931 [Stylosanthes scabra]|uniref:Uncharacterized protein n=1 Tax=Stylosanthes scabra TaxID=79078 RepID=A0ABU6ZDF4_9FABA|nr:hypothetical protein [Stylosanthes scabra]